MSEPIPIKKPHEIEAMRRACQASATVRDTLASSVKPGVTSKELDIYAAELIQKTGGKSAFYQYRGFPGQTCLSFNDEVVHGIASDRRIEYGDILKIDVGVFLDGWVGDTATTVAVGAASKEVYHLLNTTQQALDEGISFARAGNRLGDICAAIGNFAFKNKLGVVKEFVGHGVGRKMHEPPQIPNYGKKGTGPILKPGMIFAIEPMLTLGRPEVKILEDGWTVVTLDHSLSSHFEHDVLITEGDPEILSVPNSAILT